MTSTQYKRKMQKRYIVCTILTGRISVCQREIYTSDRTNVGSVIYVISIAVNETCKWPLNEETIKIEWNEKL